MTTVYILTALVMMWSRVVRLIVTIILSSWLAWIWLPTIITFFSDTP